jgi:hypothetical protein
MTLRNDYRAVTRRLGEMPFYDWAAQFGLTGRDPWIDGSFRLHRGHGDWDLYALVDMLLCGLTLEPSVPLPSSMDPQRWADRILSCLDHDGLATRRNPTRHVTEHATAYAYTGLVLLRNRGARVGLPPFRYFSSPTYCEAEFTAWFNRMGLQCPRWVPGKGLKESLRISTERLGWYHFWPGSHVGGGAMATVIMRQLLEALDGRPPAVCEVPELDAFFRLANRMIDARTGLWRPWFRRLAAKHARLGDVGGAAHFLWLYDRLGVPHPFPEAMLRTALRLQSPDGLFMNRPGCIDLDFTHLFSYAARLGARRDLDEVDQAMLRNGVAVLNHLLQKGNLFAYEDSHGLPGALCSLAQVDAYIRWRGLESDESPTVNVLAEACWI